MSDTEHAKLLISLEMVKEKKRRPKKAKKNPVSLGAVVRENLPYPVIYYPNLYGTFFAFGKDQSSQATLCLCSKPAIENLIRLKQENPRPHNAKPLRRALFDNWFFPNIIASIPLKHEHDPLEDLHFVEGLCHRCNLITPSLRYCHEMYGVEFIQHFGWYYNQVYLRLGIYPMHFLYLKDVCLPEHQKEIDAFKTARGEVRDSKKERAFTTKIENIVRQEFGFRNVGEGWVSETILYQIVKRVLNEHEILRHYRPDWLEGLELDIFFPSKKLAFEYQGQQHFHPIGLWGGLKDFKIYKRGMNVKQNYVQATESI